MNNILLPFLVTEAMPTPLRTISLPEVGLGVIRRDEAV
jgi:hypothetical protein